MAERVPPHDVLAEQSVLGSMMLSPAAVWDVLSAVESGDFYEPRHEQVFDAVGHLVRRGVGVDALSVGDELGRRGQLERMGGPAFLHELTGIPSSTTNAGYHAGIVKGLAVRRRMIDAGQQIAGWGFSLEGEVNEQVELARAAVDRVAGGQQVEAQPIGTAYDQVVESLGSKPNLIPTPWPELNEILVGLQPGRLYVVGARPGEGKALALDTPIPTPSGWTTMGQIRRGDQVLGMDGKPTWVTSVTGVQLDRRCYEVEFSDGEVIVADAEHRWLTATRASRRAAVPSSSVRTTEEILGSLRTGSDDRLNHSVATTASFELPEVDLPVDPYLFGYWLGDGSSRGAVVFVGKEDAHHVRAELLRAGYFSRETFDRNGHSRIRFSNVPVRHGGSWIDLVSTTTRLRALGVLQNKHVPDVYLRASREQRAAVLAGLIDSDGTVSRVGQVSIDVTSRALAEGAAELARSLGYLVGIRTRRVKGATEESSTCYRVRFTGRSGVCRLSRKAERLAARPPRPLLRYVVDVRPVPSVPVRCIQVDNADRMYLAGRAMVPTHNSMVGLQLADALCARGPVAFSSLEMTRAEVMARLFASKANVNMTSIERSTLTEEEWQRVAEARSLLTSMPLHLDERTDVGITQIKAYARSVSRKGPLAGVVVDYLQLVSGPSRMDRREVVSEISRNLKIMAKEFHCPVIALSQLNRDSAARGKVQAAPSLADLRESGSIEQDADLVLLLQRVVEKDGRPGDQIRFHVAKNRHGKTGYRTLRWNGAYARVEGWNRYGLGPSRVED